MQPTIQTITDVFDNRGNDSYGVEAVTQLQNALQSGLLAEEAGAGTGLVVASLLHDIGHIFEAESLPESCDENMDDRHEFRANGWLKEQFGPEVADPVRLHVLAKALPLHRGLRPRGDALADIAQKLPRPRRHNGCGGASGVRERAVFPRSTRAAKVGRPGQGHRQDHAFARALSPRTRSLLEVCMIKSAFLELLRNESPFFDSIIHGVDYWRTVERNGLYLSQFNNADKEVISYFAYVHDCMRLNEGEDAKHGLRGARFADRHRELILLDDTQFRQLTDACAGHTYGKRPDCVTINTCWDADRLDIGRVGVAVNPDYLVSEEAKRIARAKDFGVLEQFNRSSYQN